MLTEDRRALCAMFRRFFPAVVERSDLKSSVIDIPVAFPELRLVDARSVLEREAMGAVITSGLLDLVECFAAVISLSVRLCELALPVLNHLEKHPRGRVALAWLPLGDGGMTDWLLAPLLKRVKGAPLRATLREEVFERSVEGWPPDVRRGVARYQLSQYLNFLMVRSIGRSIAAAASASAVRSPSRGQDRRRSRSIRPT